MLDNNVAIAIFSGFISTLYEPKKIDGVIKFLHQLSFQQACSFFVVFYVCPNVVKALKGSGYNVQQEYSVLLTICCALSAAPIIILIKETTPKIIKKTINRGEK